MADAALAPSSRVATNVSRVERPSARGAVDAVRPAGAAAAFQQNLGAADNVVPVTPAQEQPSGNGLLSTGVQMILAETRTQEANAPFVPPSNVGRALNSYLETQAKVRETIRENAALAHTSGRVPAQPQGTAQDNEAAAISEQIPAENSAAGVNPGALAGSPIDTTIDGPHA